MPGQGFDKGGRPKGAADRVALPVSGDDAAHKAAVIGLLDELGFDAVDNGGLDDSWRHQPATPAYSGNKNIAGVEEQLAAASQVRTEKFSAARIAALSLLAGKCCREDGWLSWPLTRGPCARRMGVGRTS